MIGFFVGLVGLIGAVTLAKPDSILGETVVRTWKA